MTSGSIAKASFPHNRRMIWMESILWPLQRKLIQVREEYWIGRGWGLLVRGRQGCLLEHRLHFRGIPERVHVAWG